MDYEPELGQAVFGQPHKEHAVPRYVEAALDHLRDVLQRVQWNMKQKQVEDPFGNTGGSFKNDTFQVEAYSWDDSYEQPFNFKWGALEISWYKYHGRGMSMNREVSANECARMLDECVESLEKEEKAFFKEQGIL